MNRERMLLKANRATHDPENKASQDVQRHPTDLWSGFGFSNSLPAELLKPRLAATKDYWTDDLTSALSDTPPQIEINKVPKGLACVKEEEEFSDYNQSNISNLSSSLNRTANTQFQTNKKPAFAASANFFDTSFGSEITWDIRTFTDPAMVLTQLGCNEYLPQFREQEVSLCEKHDFNRQNFRLICRHFYCSTKKI
jgi:hypothetical protein